MNAALETLFLPFSKNILKISDTQKILFAHGQYHSTMEPLEKANISIIQPFFPEAQILKNNGYTVHSDWTQDYKPHDIALILMPKSKEDAFFTLHNICLNLKDNGQIIAAAPNDAGGKSLKKLLQSLGLKIDGEETKNKARVIWASYTKNNYQPKSLSNNTILKIEKEQFHTIVGIFGWKKVDKGSELLGQYLPDLVKGHVADFGCGYGYLSIKMLQKNSKIKSLDCLDADYRALIACEKNITDIHENMGAEYLWCDLTKPQKSLQQKYDFIMMNPPFHEGKRTSSDIGLAFIKTAYQSLKRKGTLYMVANSHLPYDLYLQDLFFSSEKLHEGGGFKIYRAEK